MHASALTPMFVGLTLTGVMAISARAHHQTVDGVDTYRYPAAIAYLMSGIGAFFCFAPFAPGTQGDMSFLSFASTFWVFALMTFVFVLYLFKYRVVIDGDRMTVGAYIKRQVDLRDIVSTKVKQGNRSAELTVNLRVGRKVMFSGMLGDFHALAAQMAACAARNSGEREPSTSGERP